MKIFLRENKLTIKQQQKIDQIFFKQKFND
jgi:hypothetical protein